LLEKGKTGLDDKAFPSFDGWARLRALYVPPFSNRGALFQKKQGKNHTIPKLCVINGLIGYVTTYAQQFYGLTATTAATLGGIRYLLQGVGGIVRGFLADKLHSRIKVIVGGCIGLIFIYAVRSQYFAVHQDAGIPLELSGRVSGISSALGYMPDMFMYTLVGSWMDNYGRTGYNMTWAYAMAAAALCIVLSFILSKVVKKEQKPQV